MTGHHILKRLTFTRDGGLKEPLEWRKNSWTPSNYAQHNTQLHFIRWWAWLSGSALVSINVVTLCQARLVLGYVCEWVNHLGMKPVT